MCESRTARQWPSAGWMLLLVAGLACADPDAGPGHPDTVGAQMGGRIVPADALAVQRGGAGTLSDMSLGGVVANNDASHLVTGSNFVSDGSLTGNAGFATVVQNTGNNVLIQNATIINLQLQ